MGSDETAIFQVNEDLSKNIGQEITFELVNRLTGNTNTATGAISGVTSGTTGYNRLKGNEEALGIRTFRMRVDRTRHAVTHETLDEQWSAIDLVENKNAVLQDWFKENIRDRIIMALGSISTDGSTHQAYASASEADKDTWCANNSDRIVFGASSFNSDHSAGLLQVDAAADGLTTTNLKILKDAAKTANPKIRPIKVKDEEEWYVVFTGTKNFRVLQASLETLNQSALQANAAKDNPLYTGGDLVYDGMIIREIPEIASLGTVGTASALVQPAYLCGTQAVGYAIAKRMKMIKDDDDYGAIVGAGAMMIDQIAKMYFGAGPTDTSTPKMNGVCVGYYAYT